MKFLLVVFNDKVGMLYYDAINEYRYNFVGVHTNFLLPDLPFIIANEHIITGHKTLLIVGGKQSLFISWNLWHTFT